MTIRMPYRLLFLITSLVFVACGSEDGGDSGSDSSADELIARLRQCNLVSDGRISPIREIPRNRSQREADNCVVSCYTSGNCLQVQDAFCSRSGPVNDCVNSCRSFTCPDGEQIPTGLLCNTRQDCSNGADEVDCTYFTCSDGLQIPAWWQCDFQTDCNDGSDELGCMLYTCRDGQQIPAEWECDFDTDCNDGSDELGCAQATCGG